ncbi:MAG: alanine--tRNA ligase [bacterium]
MNSKELRNAYLKFFSGKGHTIRPSASLIPADASLLFTVAGMVPFKDYFLGKIPLTFTRATSSQKCIRTNDIDNVGRTRRHHTFFEMLGNFSFGDYFKEETILWAWEFLTEVVKLPKEKLYITVFVDDLEAFEIWNKKAKVSADRIFKMGKSSNFWEMGPVGPCGYCSEIYVDLEGGQKNAKVTGADIEQNDDRFLEIWNLVFTEFDKQLDGSLLPLKQKNIDTGMGLERLAAVSQGMFSNFESDLFMPIIKDISEKCGVEYRKDPKLDISLRVVADHARGVSFLISDGVLPSNEGRGYVLRRLIRRAVRHGRTLGMKETFLYKVVPVINHIMGEAYPDITHRKDYIMQIIKMEEEKFQETMDKGIEILNTEIKNMQAKGDLTLSGEVAFKLYDTFGFPVEITDEILRENKMTLDAEGFKANMEKQRQLAKASWQGVEVGELGRLPQEIISKLAKTKFTGYETFEDSSSKVLAIINEKMQKIKTITTGTEAFVILDSTPFYGAGGGQMGDTGYFSNKNMRAQVGDTQKINELFIHKIKMLEGALSEGETLTATVEGPRRKAIMKNHTATHLLQAALRQVLGPHVEQAGSFVGPDRLRFDFTHFAQITPTEIKKIEQLVNGWAMESYPVKVEVLTIAEAKATGAMALFEEKYGDKVRVISVGQVSKELCAGTHLNNSGEMGLFRIISSGSTAAGIRRIEAVTGEVAYEMALEHEEFVLAMKETFKASELKDLSQKVNTFMADFKTLEKKVGEINKAGILKNVDSYIEKGKDINGIKVITMKFDNVDGKVIRELCDVIKGKVKAAVIFAANISGDKVAFICAVTKDAVDRLDAGKIVKEAAVLCGGGGGGRKDMAEAGGKDITKVDAAIKQVEETVKKVGA